jgi:outer membrane protein, multidrug efflux system
MTKSILQRDQRKLKIAAAATLIFISLPVLRAQNGPLSLQDCIDIAVGKSPRMEAGRFDLLAASAQIYAERASLWPILTGTVTAEEFSGRPTSKFGIVTAVGPEVGGGAVAAGREVDSAFIALFGADFRYPLFQNGSILGLNDAPTVERERARKKALEWTNHLTREEVIYRITHAFVTTVSAQNRVTPVERRVALLEQSFGIAKEQQGRGLLIPADVAVINEQLTGARALARVIHEQGAAGALELTRLLGLPSSTHIRLVNTLPTPPEPPSAALLLGGALGQHPQLWVQRANIERAKQDWRLERFRQYPSLILHGSALDVNDFSHDAHQYIGAVTMHIPIWDFGAQRATVRASKDRYLAEQARLASVGDDVANQVVSTYEEIYALSERMLTLQAEVGKLDRDLRVAQSQQQQGIAQPLTTIDIEVQVTGKRDELAVMESRRILLYANLQRATGGTWKWLR